ncbi:MAG: hypothetical protein GOV01_01220 [Candidatus Altiarchaeota archaeon]|nr:hypothetical protein [Candidatus Altiarchaeota archaeon]
MRYTGLLLALLIMTSVVAVPAAAQGLTADRIEGSLNPLVALIEGVTRIGWTTTQLFIGMDEASIAFFAYQLGFRGEEVYVEKLSVTVDNGITYNDRDCSVGSFAEEIVDGVITGKITATCTDDATEKDAVWFESNTTLDSTIIGDSNDDGSENMADIFDYISNTKQLDITVSNGAKGQIMLFALLIPLGMLWFLLTDFFASTGMLRMRTAQVLSIGIALIAARSGVYTALLSLISDIFGAGGFFMSMLSIYLILAVLLWFYGGVLRGKKIAESEKKVADAVTQGFAADLTRGLMSKQAAEELAKQKKE